MHGSWAGESDHQVAARDGHAYNDPVASIITAYNRNFRPILPKKNPFGADTSGKHTIRPKICLELIEQYEITVQLLIQNFLYCNDEAIKQQCLEHFLRLVNGKEAIIKFYRLPSYEICLSDFVGVLSDPQKFGSPELASLYPACHPRSKPSRLTQG